jgi:Fe2+ or Zn2+ uptake regulation protein
MGTAVVWHINRQFQAEEFYHSINKEVFDTRLYTIYRALYRAQYLHDTGEVFTKFAIFSDAQAILQRQQNNHNGPG